MTEMSLDDLTAKFALKNQLQFNRDANGLITIEVNNSMARASIAMQGAHLMHWTPHRQQPVVWLSPGAKFAVGKSIRGGVPICWPWFGPHASDAKLPGHGHARTVPWQLMATSARRDGATALRFELIEEEKYRAWWPPITPVTLRMTIGQVLELQLTTRNDSQQPVTIGQALHTYFAVGDVRQIAIHGLGHCEYIDKVDGGKRKPQTGALRLSEETDRIYLQTLADTLIDDPTWRRRIRIHKRGSTSTVVWNPWRDKAKSMGDFGADEGYLDMVCVETANAADDVVTIAPGASHSLSVSYALEPLR